MDFKEEVRALIEEYDAPQNIQDELIKFLINSENMYEIVNLNNKSNGH